MKINSNLELNNKLPDNVWVHEFGMKQFQPMSHRLDGIWTGVVIPKNIHDLKKYTFYDCKSLKNIDFSNLERLTEDAFYNCDNLTELYFTEKTVEIQFWCFQACTNISKVTILNPTANLISPLNLDVKKATIVGHYGSTAHDMAEDFGFRFISLEDPALLPEPEGVDVSTRYTEKRETVNGKNIGQQNYLKWKNSEKSNHRNKRVSHIRN